MECLQNIIGLIRKDCQCITGELDNDQIKELTTSKSGLFIDSDLNDAIKLYAMDNKAACKSMYNIFMDSRRAAISKFREEMFAGLYSTNTKVDSYNGELNKRSFVGPLQGKGNYNFIRLHPSRVSDANIIIRSVQIAVNLTDTITLQVLKLKKGEYVPEVIHNQEVDTLANKFVNVILDVELNIYENNEVYDYYIVWSSANEHIRAMDTECYCGCASQDSWKRFVSMQGGHSERLDTMHQAKTGNFSQGIYVDSVSIHCKLDKFICREFNSNDSVSLVSAWAILYKTGCNIIDAILNSSEISRYTTMNREPLYGKRNHFDKEYANRVQHLLATIDTSKSDCFTCKPTKMTMGSLLA